MARMTGGQAVVESLEAHGVEVTFGVISVHTLQLFDALYHARDELRYIAGRLELACGYMADGYARATGRPGVLITSCGPGAADSVGAMGEAYHSSSSVLQITTNVEKELINSGRGPTHEAKDQLGMFRSVTDWNALIDSVEEIPDRIYEAFERFKTRRPRPIELEVPTDLLAETADVEVVPPRDTPLPQGEPSQVERVAAELARARRPIIYAGEEVLFADATPELVRLAELLGAPVVTAAGGKGAFPEDHPLSLGLALARRIWGENPVQEFIPTCDLALVVGAALPYRTTVGVGFRMPERLIHVVPDGELIGKNYPATIGIVGNSKAVLAQVLSLLEGKDVHKGDSYRREIQETRSRIYRGLREQFPNELRTYEAVRSLLPRDTITVWGGAVHSIAASRCFPVYQPRTYMSAHGWSGIGFGFPAALGVKTALPQRPVVCMTGDGSFQYNMQELGTAVQYGLNPVVVVFNDGGYGVLRRRQVNLFDGRLIGTDLLNPDFAKLADAYGIQGTRVATLDGLLKALDSAIASPHIQLIEVGIPQGFGAFR